MLASDLNETCEDCVKKTKKCDGLIVKIRELENGLAALCDAPNVSEEKRERLNLQVAFDAKAIAHLATFVRDNCSNCLCLTTENVELQRWVNDLEQMTCQAESSLKRFRANVSFVSGGREALAAKCEELALEVQYTSGLDSEARNLRAHVAELEKSSNTKVSNVRAKH